MPGQALGLGLGLGLEELAQVAAMSGSAFVRHFRAVAGMPPLTYLSRHRMLLAQRALTHGDTRIGTLAVDLGFWVREAVILDGLHEFLAERVFGAYRHQLLADNLAEIDDRAEHARTERINAIRKALTDIDSRRKRLVRI